MAWKLKRTAQCAKCPWRKDVDPHDIPNGYDEDKHRALVDTIADPDNPMASFAAGGPLRIMACHESEAAHCVGWLANQLGAGNNIALRMQVRTCSNIGRIRLVGEQHATIHDTFPAASTR